MCFYNDGGDWSASVNEEKFYRGDKACQCFECGEPILAGDWRREIHQQEHDCCQICEDEWSGDFIDRDDMNAELLYGDIEWARAELKTLNEHKCDYGESFDGSLCRKCCLLLEAVYDLEAKEGCPEHSRQPLIGNLWDELCEDRDQVYVKHAIGMFPELAEHKLCQRLAGV